MDAPPPAATNVALSVVGALFYVSGGLSALVVASVSGVHHPGWLRLIGGLAAIAGLLVARFAARIPRFGRCAMNFAGTGLVLAIVLLAGPTVGGAALFWVFCYVPIDSFFFFPWRWAIPMQLWGLAATAIAVFVGHVISPIEWIVMAVVAFVVAFAVGWLIRTAADAEWDQGTDMLGRRGFDRALAIRCGESIRAGHRFALATLSIDAIERVITRDGRAAAELLLRRLATNWTATAPTSAHWARIRDHGFAILWDDSPGFDAYLEQVRVEAATVNTVSIGVVDVRPGDTPVQVMTKAMAGLSYSERSGGDRITRHGLIAEAVDELAAAIAAGQIAVFYQPIVSLGDGQVLGAEALARWHHPQRGLLSPDEFIDLAEQADLIGALGAFVLRRACHDAVAWCPERDAPVTVAVNVSGQQLRDTGFPAMVRQCLADAGLDPNRLVLEVTESTVAGDDVVSQAALRQLRALGLRIAIDDFGTGYSNLSRLAGMPVDVLKLDRSFIEQIEGSPRTRALVRGLIAMAKALDLTTVVEGVETQDQAWILRALGGQEGQGWLWGQPVPVEQFRLGEAQQIDTAI